MPQLVPFLYCYILSHRTSKQCFCAPCPTFQHKDSFPILLSEVNPPWASPISTHPPSRGSVDFHHTMVPAPAQAEGRCACSPGRQRSCPPTEQRVQLSAAHGKRTGFCKLRVPFPPGKPLHPSGPLPVVLWKLGLSALTPC